MSGDLPGFTRADRLPQSGLARSMAESTPETEVAVSVIRPDLTLDQAKEAWDKAMDFRDAILAHPDCADDIAGKRQMNRTGATRLALAFGLSIKGADLFEGRVQEADSGEFDYRYLVTVRVSKGARFVDGVGSCRLSEIPAKTKAGEIVPISQREHFAMTRAWTRAAKRAIADILGGTEAE